MGDSVPLRSEAISGFSAMVISVQGFLENGFYFILVFLFRSRSFVFLRPCRVFTSIVKAFYGVPRACYLRLWIFRHVRVDCSFWFDPTYGVRIRRVFALPVCWCWLRWGPVPPAT